MPMEVSKTLVVEEEKCECGRIYCKVNGGVGAGVQLSERDQGIENEGVTTELKGAARSKTPGKLVYDSRTGLNLMS